MELSIITSQLNQKVILWDLFVKEKVVKANERRLIVKVVSIIRKCFGEILGNGDVLVDTTFTQLNQKGDSVTQHYRPSHKGYPFSEG